MANPDYPVNILSNQWTKIATNVTTGQVHNKKTDVLYLQTYRLTGEAAPTTIDEGVSMFNNNETLEYISSSDPIDVYIWAVDNNGILRVDV